MNKEQAFEEWAIKNPFHCDSTYKSAIQFGYQAALTSKVTTGQPFKTTAIEYLIEASRIESDFISTKEALSELAAIKSTPAASVRKVGCELPDGTIKVHPENEFCEVCRASSEMELRGALEGDGCLSIEISNLDAIAYHLEQGQDNGDLTRTALSAFLRTVSKRLMASRNAISRPPPPVATDKTKENV